RHLVERVALQTGDHRPEKLSQRLVWRLREVDEDEPLPHLAVHPNQAVAALVEVEEFAFLLDKGQVAVEVIPPGVVLAGELPTRSFGLFQRHVIPHQLVATMPTHVVVGLDLAGSVAHQDYRGVADLQFLREITAFARNLLHAANIQPSPLEDRLAFQVVNLGTYGDLVGNRSRAELGVMLGPATLYRL